MSNELEFARKMTNRPKRRTSPAARKMLSSSGILLSSSSLLDYILFMATSTGSESFAPSVPRQIFLFSLSLIVPSM